MELQEFIGTKMFSGFDRETIHEGGEDVEQIKFIFDGKKYRATEDGNDGYRSSLGELIEYDGEVKNTFPSVQVVCIHRGGDNENILELRRVSDNALILEFGTDNIDDYYPSFICHYTPENLGTV